MENSSSAQLSPFEVDVSGIQRPANIRTEKDLEIEIGKISETLKDTCK